MHTSRLSIDWAGTYQGTTPCADCPGIETTIILNEDTTYLWLSHYQDKGNNLFAKKGKFEWNEDGTTLTLTSRENKERLIRVGEDQLFLLDQNGESIRGELSDHDILKKVYFQQLPEAEDLLEVKKWVLVEIENDSNSQIDSMEQRPFLEFDTQKKRISGFAGCNRFFGQYSVEKDSTTQFSEIGATKKYCMDTMETEDLFLDVLRKCRYLKINKTMLIMEDRNHEKMAVFSKQNTKAK